jgi:hypothetical protein
VKQSSTSAVNQRRGTDGELWQPRFFGRALRTVKEYNEKVEYIHLNPVRAGLVSRAEDWRWSSYHEYAGTGADEQNERCGLIVRPREHAARSGHTLFDRFTRGRKDADQKRWSALPAQRRAQRGAISGRFGSGLTPQMVSKCGAIEAPWLRGTGKRRYGSSMAPPTARKP